MGKQKRVKKREERAIRRFKYRLKVYNFISEHFIQVDLSENLDGAHKSFATVIMPLETWNNNSELKKIIDNAVAMKLAGKPVAILETRK